MHSTRPSLALPFPPSPPKYPTPPGFREALVQTVGFHLSSNGLPSASQSLSDFVPGPSPSPDSSSSNSTFKVGDPFPNFSPLAHTFNFPKEPGWHPRSLTD